MLCNLSKIIDEKKKKRITEERGGKEKEKTEEDVYSYNDYWIMSWQGFFLIIKRKTIEALSFNKKVKFLK